MINDPRFQGNVKQSFCQKLPKATANKRILKLPEGYEYTNLRVRKNLIQFYCNKLDSESQIKDWAKLFGDLSSVKWKLPTISMPSICKSNRAINYIYRVEFRCHQSWPTYKIQHSNSIKCPVRLVIKKVSDSNNDDSPQTLVLLYNDHNHESSLDVENKILQMYSRGHNPDSVYSIWHFDSNFNLGKSKSSNTKTDLPSLQYCNRLFDQMHPKPEKIRIHSLKITLQKWVNDTHGSAVLDTDNGVMIVTLITSFMRRVQTLEKSKGILFLEKVVSRSKPNFSMYILSIPGVVGELPVCYIIISSTKTVFLKRGLEQFTNISSSLGSKGIAWPTYVVTNDTILENNANVIMDVWPATKLFMSSQYCLRTVWSWLNDYSASSQETIFLAFKNLLTAKTETVSLKYYKELQTVCLPDFIDYLSTFWEIKEAWCLCYLKDLVTVSTLEKTYINYFIQDIKDIFLKSVNKLNMCQLVDFIITRLDMYYNSRFVNIINKEFQISRLRTLLPETSISMETVYVIDDSTYLITESEDHNYIVDIKLGFCTCSIGRYGRMCQHISAVVLYYMKSIDGTNHTHTISNYQYLLGSRYKKKILVHSNTMINKPDDNFSEDMKITRNANFDQKRSIFEENKSPNADEINTDQTVNEMMDLGQAEYDSEELTATDVVRILRVEESPFSENLRMVFNGIVERVKNNPNLQQAAVEFCENYKKYCNSNFSLILSLNYFGELLKSSSEQCL